MLFWSGWKYAAAVEPARSCQRSSPILLIDGRLLMDMIGMQLMKTSVIKLILDRWCLIALALAPAGLPRTTCADEGMWLYNNPPRKQLTERYGFEPSDAWLEHLQKSSVRFNSGGS